MKSVFYAYRCIVYIKVFEVYCFDESYLGAFIYVYCFDKSYLGAFIYVLGLLF